MKVRCFSKRSKGCFKQRVGLGFGFTNILQETWVHMFQPTFLLNCLGFPIEAWIFHNFVMFYPPEISMSDTMGFLEPWDVNLQTHLME